MLTLRIDRRWLLAIPAVIAFLVYLPTLNNTLVWDDVSFLYDSPLYRDLTLGWGVIWKPFVISANYFRPLALLSLVLEMRVAGLNPALLHFDNLILHALNTALVTWLAGELISRDGDNRKTLVQVGIGLLYGLHPALVEGVVFISSRFDLLVTLFLLLALVADLKLESRGTWHAVSVGLLFLLAALAKEMAIAFVIVYPLWYLATREKELPDSISRSPSLFRSLLTDLSFRRTVAAITLAGVAYLIIRLYGMGYLLLPGVAHVATGDPLQHFLLVARSYVEYLLVIVLPFLTLTPVHFANLPIPATDPLAWTAVLALVFIAYGLYRWIKRDARSGLLATAAALSLLPVVNILPLDLTGGAFIAERFMLFPLTLLALSLGAPLSRWLMPARTGAITPARLFYSLSALWLAASLLTIELTIPHWQNNLTLWGWASERAPNSGTVFVNLSLELSKRGDYANALLVAQRAIQLNPNDGLTWNNAGLALYNSKRYDEALADFTKATQVEPRNALFWNNLAGVLIEQKKYQEAEKILIDEALKRDPNQPLAMMNLGALYLQVNRPDLAVNYLNQAARLAPPDQTAKVQALLKQAGDPVIWMKLADLALQQGDGKSALSALDQARALGGDQVEIAVGATAAFLTTGDLDSAEKVAQSLASAAPNDARAYNYLGVIAQKRGNNSAASDLFTRAIQLAPNWDLPKQNLASLPK